MTENYEVVIEQLTKGIYEPNRFSYRPTVIATSEYREVAILIAENLVRSRNEDGEVATPFPWDTVSVWDRRTGQFVVGYQADKMKAKDSDGQWIGRSDWLKSGAVQHGHCSQ